MSQPLRPARLAGVIFDLGGTLIYPSTTDEDGIRRLTDWLVEQGWPEAVGEALREARQWVLESTAATGRQHTMQEGIRRALRQFADRSPGPAFIEAAEHVFFEPELAGYRPFPGAVRLLHQLARAGLALACISNATSHWLIQRIVDGMGFGPFFDPVVSSAGFGRPKPDPAIFHSVLQQWNLTPDRVAMVGDTLATDIAGARGAGMRSVYVTMRPNPENAAHLHIRADAEAGTLAEAGRVLLEWARED
ncbi:MAG: HAD family hydrolase [Armatimonadota bacterium]|nr:HAD family hydrolase [Armatimonadota bacterium]MDR7421061.1 HAD family hydrolase [Armatimonadota bacterium]MDR7453192.1 HAD family hydrolase [Armatimonadota bacterium]MDR7456852.1 HAD family hydrolase [Armatimonadota bacterium]MDR7510390.1 HAD family hydrolase [Armatimonadota bacterium]